MDRYVYIKLTQGDTDRTTPSLIRFEAVAFGRDVKAEVFDKRCKPARPLDDLVQKLLGVTNKELEKYPPQAEVRLEFLRFIEGAHIVCDDVNLLQSVSGINIVDTRSLADVRRVNGAGYFDQRYRDVLEEAENGELSMADIQRIALCAFYEACDIVDDCVFFDFLKKTDKKYILTDEGARFLEKNWSK